mmetsp:Transcript_123420/g.356800  ORF Transcript_123420/g.356800 Transcript_123420/m.356800 type:complete len:747 (+) Transcript_123420:149-2389(+)
MIADGADRLKAVLAQRGNGSLLRGWRRELDADGSLDVGFREFCEAALRLGVSVDAEALFGLDSPESLTLEELAAPEGQLVERFREWMTAKFGGPGEMFIAFENGASQMEADGKLHLYEFVRGLHQHEFDATEEEMQQLFQLLDMEDLGRVEMEDVMFLETDKKRREGAILKAKMKHRRDRETFLHNAYRADMSRSVPRTHRRALRGWQAAAVERLPAVVQERRLHWRRRLQERIQAAGAAFAKHVREKHGNGVRAWRQGLDPTARFVVTRTGLGRYCRTVNLDIDVNCLWKSLDQDSDGVLFLEEVGKQHAAALARFHCWAHGNFGSCVAAWERLRAMAEPTEKWRSDKTMRYAPFLKVLTAHGWPGGMAGGDSPTSMSVGTVSTSIPDAGLNTMLCTALDFRGSGLVTLQDFQWLDTWSPPEYLMVDPDPEAWSELRAKMLKVSGGQPLAAWRLLLDTKDQNHASWPEFLAASKKVGFSGNVGGAWRHLDADTSGSISLQEYDSESADLLASFKEWIETHFGCVEFAFRTMDTDGSGSVCFSELRRACNRLGYQGNVRQIFEFLDIDVEPGKRTLSYKELAFLDNWVPQVEDAAPDCDTIGMRSPRSSITSSNILVPRPSGGPKPLLPVASESASGQWRDRAAMRRSGSCPGDFAVRAPMTPGSCSPVGTPSNSAWEISRDEGASSATEGHRICLPSVSAAATAQLPSKARRKKGQHRGVEVAHLLPIATAGGGQRLVSLLSPPR